MTTWVQMLMYGKEASNRKQEIDRQHHTIPTTTESLLFLYTMLKAQDRKIHNRMLYYNKNLSSGELTQLSSSRRFAISKIFLGIVEKF